MTLHKTILTPLVLLVLFGCTPKYLTVLEPIPDSYTPTINLVDVRPDSQKETAFVSLNIANCKYGSFQVGDESLKPDRITILQHYLDGHLDTPPSNLEINLKNYTIHVNRSAMLRKNMSEQFQGVMADKITSQHTMGCSQDDLFGGYNSSEVPEGRIPLIVVIDIEMDGKTYHGRGVIPLQDARAGKQIPTWNSDVQSAITAAMNSLISAIKNEQFVLAPR